ncbi:12561_t:CDS:2 [Rhizophagus irregularis]|nr:12561_t:CDS:2 [Rhizophagus irregularis]
MSSSTRYNSSNTQDNSDNSPSLNNVLEIANKIEYKIGPVTFPSSQTASSIQLIDLIREILDLSFSELFPGITKSIASLPNDIESTLWIKNHSITDDKIVCILNCISNQIYGIASLAAMYGNYFDSLERVRQFLKQIYDIDTGKDRQSWTFVPLNNLD